MPNARQLISSGARRRGLDPLALLAVASVEGGFNGAVGDRGTSGGPFQLHIGGALPRARSVAWANSPQGINYALDQIDRVAHGKHGRAAVEAIVRQFERPAAPGTEISKALGRYGKVGGGEASPAGLRAQAAAPAAAPDKMALLGLLGQRNPDVGALALLLSASRQAAGQNARSSRPAPQSPVQARSEHSAGGINELFYDPLGGIKDGAEVGAIGGHGMKWVDGHLVPDPKSAHVHISLRNEAAQRLALAQARKLGLRVGEEADSDVHPVHVTDSYHYRHYRKGDPLRQAADVSGDARGMTSFYKWVAAHFGGR